MNVLGESGYIGLVLENADIEYPQNSVVYQFNYVLDIQGASAVRVLQGFDELDPSLKMEDFVLFNHLLYLLIVQIQNSIFGRLHDDDENVELVLNEELGYFQNLAFQLAIKFGAI